MLLDEESGDRGGRTRTRLVQADPLRPKPTLPKRRADSAEAHAGDRDRPGRTGVVAGRLADARAALASAEFATLRADSTVSAA